MFSVWCDRFLMDDLKCQQQKIQLVLCTISQLIWNVRSFYTLCSADRFVLLTNVCLQGSRRRVAEGRMMLPRCMSAGFVPSSSASLKRLAATWTGIVKARSYPRTLANCALVTFLSNFMGDWFLGFLPERENETLNRARQLVFGNESLAAVGAQMRWGIQNTPPLQSIMVGPAFSLIRVSYGRCNFLGVVSGMSIWEALPHRPC